LIVRGRSYSSCVQSGTLHGSETWTVRKENEVALQGAKMRMVRWMCGVKLQDRVPSKGLRKTRITTATTTTTILRPLNFVWITRVSRYQKGKINLDLLEQETVSGSGIRWVICKYAPRPRQITRIR